MRKRLGEMLLDTGFIDQEQLSAGLSEQSERGGKLGTALVKKGFISEETLGWTLHAQIGVKLVSLKNRPIAPEALSSISPEIAREYKSIPIALDGTVLSVAMSDPGDLNAVDTLGFVTGKRIRPLLALESDIAEAIKKYYGTAAVGKPVFRAAEVEEALEAPGKVVPKKGQTKPKVKPVTVERTLASLIRLLMRKHLISKRELLRMMDEE